MMATFMRKDLIKMHNEIPENKKSKKSQAYIAFLQDVKEFNEGNFKPSKRGLITVKLGGL